MHWGGRGGGHMGGHWGRHRGFPGLDRVVYSSGGSWDWPWWYWYWPYYWNYYYADLTPAQLLSLASDLDLEAQMTTDPILQEKLITQAAEVRSLVR
jgi:hypothetical protein